MAAPCLKRLDAECFRANPEWAKRAFAYRLVHILTPKPLTKRLPRGLQRALVYPGTDMPPGVNFPPGTIVSPGATIPPGWQPGDPYPPGVIPPGGVPGATGGAVPYGPGIWHPGTVNHPGRYSLPAAGTPQEDTFYSNHSEDDGTWVPSTYFSSTSQDIRAGYYVFGTPWNCYMIFSELWMPKGATITSATLTLTAKSDQAGPSVFWRIYGNDVDNPTQPTGYADCDALDLTNAYVSWAPGAWTQDSTYESDDITDIIQEIVNRDGWEPYNDLMLIVKDSQIGEDYRDWYSFNAGVPAKYPALAVNWLA